MEPDHDCYDYGWTLWSAFSSSGGRDPVTGQLIDAHGGVVVEQRWRPVEDGEYITVDGERAEPEYVCVDLGPHREARTRVLAHAEVGEAIPPDPVAIQRLVRRLGGWLGYKGPRVRLSERSGDLSDFEVNVVTYMQRLTAVAASLRPPRRFAPTSTERYDYRPAPGGVFVD